MKHQKGAGLLTAILILVFLGIITAATISLYIGYQERNANLEITNYFFQDISREYSLAAAFDPSKHYKDKNAVFDEKNNKLCPEDKYENGECQGGPGMYHETEEGYSVRCPGGHWDEDEELCTH